MKNWLDEFRKLGIEITPELEEMQRTTNELYDKIISNQNAFKVNVLTVSPHNKDEEELAEMATIISNSAWDELWEDCACYEGCFGVNSSEIDKLLEDFEEALRLDLDEPPDFNAEEYDKYDIKKKKGDGKCRFHKWVKTGESPIHGTEWYNCEKCSIDKEEWEKGRK